MATQREKFVVATKELVDSVTKVLENVNKRFGQIGASQFVTAIAGKGIHNVVDPLWTGYWKWLSAVGVTTREEMEELQKSFGDDKEVLKCTEELHTVEIQFAEFMAKLNAVVQKEEDKVLIIIAIYQ